MIRKLFAALSVLVIASMMLTACGAPTTSAPATSAPATSAPATSGEIKLGYIAPFTGVFSFATLQSKQGAILALEEVNYIAGGKKITVIYEDDQLDNTIAVEKAKKLVEQDKIDIMTGLMSGDEGLSVADYLKDKPIPIIPMYSASEDMTMRDITPYVVRPTWTGAQSMDVFGYWLAKDKGYKKIYHIGEDYSFPWNEAGGFKRGFCRGGGEVVTTIWHPVGTVPDFSSLISAIPTDQGYDSVIYNGSGGDADGFIKQYVELGMLKKIPLITQSNSFEYPDLSLMPTDIALPTSYSPQMTADDLATPEFTKFSDAYKARFGEQVSSYSAFAYTSMRLILRAIEAVNGDVSDPKAFVDAMVKVNMLDDPRGPITIDPTYRAATANVYIRVVDKKADGTLYNKGLVTVKNVSQFGPYDPATYLAQPKDDNTYPPDECSKMPAVMMQDPTPYQFIPFGQ
jgi:branched-chain amino acid transport system substrate-binding protein